MNYKAIMGEEAECQIKQRETTANVVVGKPNILASSSLTFLPPPLATSSSSNCSTSAPPPLATSSSSNCSTSAPPPLPKARRQRQAWYSSYLHKIDVDDDAEALMDVDTGAVVDVVSDSDSDTVYVKTDSVVCDTEDAEAEIDNDNTAMLVQDAQNVYTYRIEDPFANLKQM